MFNVHAIREPKTDTRGCNVFSEARILFLVVAVVDNPASAGCQGCNVFFEALLGRKESQAMGKQGVHIYFQRLPSLGYQGQLSSCVCNIRGVNRECQERMQNKMEEDPGHIQQHNNYPLNTAKTHKLKEDQGLRL